MIDTTDISLRCAIRADSHSQTVFLPIIGLVPHDKLKPGDLIGVNKDSYLVLDALPDGKLLINKNP